ncbi:MAG: toxin-antitoxin system, antitoxin component [Balneolaceae bacterium]|nr:MAG: toxin-antitoxin system, antitoxin component [Balneolaceae bacterium]
MKKVEKAEQAEKLSISKWVKKKLKKSLRADYPYDFQNLHGSIRDENFTVPERYK